MTETTTTGTAVSKTTYRKFADRYRAAQKDVDDAQEDRKEVMHAAGEAQIHKGAFRFVQKLMRLDSAAAQEFLECVNTYADWEGLQAQQRLPLDTPAEETAGGKRRRPTATATPPAAAEPEPAGAEL